MPSPKRLDALFVEKNLSHTQLWAAVCLVRERVVVAVGSSCVVAGLALCFFAATAAKGRAGVVVVVFVVIFGCFAFVVGCDRVLRGVRGAAGVRLQAFCAQVVVAWAVLEDLEALCREAHVAEFDFWSQVDDVEDLVG
jgi:hypothetical protein